MSTRDVGIFGSTGSIGRNALEVIRSLPDHFRVSFLSTNSNAEVLIEQALAFRPGAVAIASQDRVDAVRRALPDSIRVYAGPEGLLELARLDGTDIVVSALVGFAGVAPTAEAIRCGKDIALANKETLVAAGEYIKRLVQEHGVRLLPVDSEHSAILQCLAGERPEDVEKLLLTASGGPFRGTPAEAFASISVEQALKHPNWSMGKKITIDSATLMNKGLEVIEAHWLFDLPQDRIEVVIHPQSIIHSMVEFRDGSFKAQLGLPDMKLPIQYALTYPERLPMNGPRVSFPDLGQMTFESPDMGRFPALRLAYDALRTGGTHPAALNAANEVAVIAFLDGRTSFASIPEVLERTLSSHRGNGSTGIDEIIGADSWARRKAADIISTLSS